MVLWFGVLITSSSFSMVVPFLPLFLLKIGVHQHVEMWSGLLFSIAFLFSAIMSPYWGSLADKYGRKPMILRSGIALFITYSLTAFATNPYELLALRAFQGLLSGYIPSAIALVGTNTPESKVGYALAMVSTASSTGNIVGPLVGGVLSRLFGDRVAFGSAGAIMLIATLLCWLWVREDAFVPAKTRSSVLGAWKEVLDNKPLLMTLCITSLTAFSIMTIEPVLPLYIAEIGGSLNNASLLAGIVFSIAGIASVLFAARWGRLADRIGFRRVLLVGLMGGALGNIAQIPFHEIWGFSGIRFLYGAFFCAVFPALNGLVVQQTRSEFRGRAFGLNQTANQAGTLLGPLAGGALGSAFGPHSVFLVTGLLLLVTTGMAYFGQRAWSSSKAAGGVSPPTLRS
ncbi:MFS transporter [Alicyclobacillus contaminans]|uniref:MFS transporter n=1 Tax=Alicyclobacillus contaminans TaxID=392016 RepID=UPI00054EE2DA|nr:MFS transporter [Alicyclobacillus contaminans]